VESLPRRMEAVIETKGRTNSILMPIILEWNVQRAAVHILLVMYCSSIPCVWCLIHSVWVPGGRQTENRDDMENFPNTIMNSCNYYWSEKSNCQLPSLFHSNSVKHCAFWTTIG
jgi:hypothetical protein